MLAPLWHLRPRHGAGQKGQRPKPAYSAPAVIDKDRTSFQRLLGQILKPRLCGDASERNKGSDKLDLHIILYQLHSGNEWCSLSPRGLGQACFLRLPLEMRSICVSPASELVFPLLASRMVGQKLNEKLRWQV